MRGQVTGSLYVGSFEEIRVHPRKSVAKKSSHGFTRIYTDWQRGAKGICKDRGMASAPLSLDVITS
jgi:hypothetical protein